MAHWKKENIAFEAIYTGYLGSTGQIAYVKEMLQTLGKETFTSFVDPAMADGGKLYKGFADDFPMKMRRLCEVADYILPNLTEAAFLLGRKPVLEGYDKDFVEEMVRALHAIGAKNVILTGVSLDPSKLGFACYDGKETRYYFNERIPRLSHGTGDVYASVFAGALMRGRSMYDAAALAADIVCKSIIETPEDHWYGVCFEKAIPELVGRLG